jgi:glutamyl/glutaminyl-tRNA synthetase
MIRARFSPRPTGKLPIKETRKDLFNWSGLKWNEEVTFFSNQKFMTTKTYIQG